MSIKTVSKVVLNSNPCDSPLIVATFTIFGAAIIFSFYPNTIAIAIALPVEIPASAKDKLPEESDTNA
jgi:hypothetical protein